MLTIYDTIHPAAECFPLISEEEADQLVGNIRRQGVLCPIVLWKDSAGQTVLLDGRNRINACQALGITPPVTWYDGYYEGDDPIGHIVSLNVARRHLTASQKALVALELMPLYEAQAREKQRAQGERGAEGGRGHRKEETLEAPGPQGFLEEPQRAPRARDLAAEAVGASGRSVARVKRIAEEAPCGPGISLIINSILS